MTITQLLLFTSRPTPTPSPTFSTSVHGSKAVQIPEVTANTSPPTDFLLTCHKPVLPPRGLKASPPLHPPL